MTNQNPLNMKCPLCGGTGYIHERPAFIKEIFRLREMKLSMRQIGKAVGLSANTVHYHLHKWSSPL